MKGVGVGVVRLRLVLHQIEEDLVLVLTFVETEQAAHENRGQQERVVVSGQGRNPGNGAVVLPDLQRL
jgi:hypothetical protein